MIDQERVKMTRIYVKAKPEVLRVLRETAGYTREEIARKLRTSVRKIERVEAGEDRFTLNQIKKLADIYHRPLAAFFSDKIRPLPPAHIFWQKDYDDWVNSVLEGDDER